VIAQRDALAEFGVPIEGFRHPAPETGESWSERLTRLFGRSSKAMSSSSPTSTPSVAPSRDARHRRAATPRHHREVLGHTRA
jgi:hypothetical protein